jgi:hypothetical protein
VKTSFKDRAVPAKIGAAIDELYATRQHRLEEMGAIKDMSDYETRLKNHLIDTLPKSDASGVAGKFARAQITTKKVPTVQDWDAFYKYVKKNNAWELLQRRVNDQAVYDRWDAGKVIPGVGEFTTVSVSVTKL